MDLSRERLAMSHTARFPTARTSTPNPLSRCTLTHLKSRGFVLRPNWEAVV